MNIKNPRVHALARQAAQRFGMSQTSVIEQALERLLATADQAESVARIDRAHAVLVAVDVTLTEPDRVAIRESLDGLYDQAGLPQ